MTSRGITLAGYAAIGAAALALEVLAWRGSARIVSLGRLLGRVMRTRAGRVGVITAWAWFGLHLFAR